MAYRNLVTTTGQFNTREIMAHAHRKARDEWNLNICVAAGLKCPAHIRPGDTADWRARAAVTVNFSKIDLIFTYAHFFKQELRFAWRYARAIRSAGQGEAAASAVPAWRQAA